MMTSSEFADVTLVTDDKQQIRAHRNILSGCSPVFKNILQIDRDNANPIIYLRGIQYSEMESIMQFIYLGEARFCEERMSEFLLVAKNLEIKNLSTSIEMKDDPTSSNEESSEHQTTFADNDVDEDPAKTLNEDGEYFDNQTHTSTKPTTRNKTINKSCKYACNQCDYQATHQGNLTVHIQSKHEGVKYACNKCDYQAKRPYILRSHIQSIHEGVKYSCNECEKQFTQRNNLTVHIQTIHEGVTHDCNQCDYQARGQSNLLNHIKKMHL